MKLETMLRPVSVNGQNISGAPQSSTLPVSCSAPGPLVPPLPEKVTIVPREVIRAFPHSKRVGNYLLGKTLGEGSFAKVKEGLHILTGEKVSTLTSASYHFVDKPRSQH